ncbi:nudix hydrolase 4 [Euphorbia lathyris]|uniref:nudix hydrolase 4 n=1 Tax=Euphorbia lathyris TaxID=212925 RepID=UPI003313722A
MGGLSFFVRNFATFLSFLIPLLEKFPSKLLPAQLEKLVSSLARTGRDLQRYDHRGFRQVVGCIPYRYKKSNSLMSSKEIEVLVISAMKGDGMLFPKGGWENDESMVDAGMRETFEEAGVSGEIEEKLGKWFYMSKRGSIMHEGHMFPMLVQKQLDHWPEKNIRKRRWVSVKEGREVLQLTWMREALEALVQRHDAQKQ